MNPLLTEFNRETAEEIDKQFADIPAKHRLFLKSFMNTRAAVLVERIREKIGKMPEEWTEERWHYGNELLGMFDERFRILALLSTED